jgi:hypothetical protein
VRRLSGSFCSGVLNPSIASYPERRSLQSPRSARTSLPASAIKAAEKQWLSFNAREDFLHGIRVGTIVDVGRMGTSETTPALVTELLPLGPFATWQAERAVGDYDRNTLRLRLGPQPCVGMRSSSCQLRSRLSLSW